MRSWKFFLPQAKLQLIFALKCLFVSRLNRTQVPRLRCQTKSRYVQTVPDGKCLCPDPPRRKVPMSRLSCFQNCICPDYRAFKIAYVQTIVRSKLHMSRLLCVQNCICPDCRAFKIAYIQTIVRSKFHMTRISCVHFFQTVYF